MAQKSRNILDGTSANTVLLLHTHTETYGVCLIFPVVEVVAVVENILVGGVETGFHAVLHHLACPGGTLQLLDLNTNVTQHMVEFTSKSGQTHTVSAGGYLSEN